MLISNQSALGSELSHSSGGGPAVLAGQAQQHRSAQLSSTAKTPPKVQLCRVLLATPFRYAGFICHEQINITENAIHGASVGTLTPSSLRFGTGRAYTQLAFDDMVLQQQSNVSTQKKSYGPSFRPSTHRLARVRMSVTSARGSSSLATRSQGPTICPPTCSV